MYKSKSTLGRSGLFEFSGDLDFLMGDPGLTEYRVGFEMRDFSIDFERAD